MDRLSAIFELRTLLRQLECDVGLDRLNQNERDVILAARDLSGKLGNTIESEDLRNHEFVCSQAQATFYRSLRSLLDNGFLRRAEGTRAKCYVLSREVFDK